MDSQSAHNLCLEVLSHKVLNRIINDQDTRTHLRVSPPSDDDVDILGSMLFQGHIGCYYPTGFFYAALKLLFPSFDLNNRVVRKVRKSRNHTDVDWQTISEAGKISSVCYDFHRALFGKGPRCGRCNQSVHFTQLRKFLLGLRKEKGGNERKNVDIHLLKLSAYENFHKQKIKKSINELNKLSKWFKSQKQHEISAFYVAFSKRCQTLLSKSSQEIREHFLEESSILSKIGLRVESSRALADYFGVLAEVEPSAYRCAMYDFYAYALRRREVFGCIAYAKDLFEYYKHMMCHYLLLNNDKLAIEHAEKAEHVARQFGLENELRTVRSIMHILTRTDETQVLFKGRKKGALSQITKNLEISETYKGELSDVGLLYTALRTPDFKLKARVFQTISDHLSEDNEDEIARYYAFLAELHESMPLSKTHRDNDIFKIRRIVSKYKFDEYEGAEIHRQIVGILLQLAERSHEMSASELKKVRKELAAIEETSKSLFNDEMMANVTKITHEIISELEKYSSLSRSDTLKIADISIRLVKLYEDEVPGLLKYMTYPELVELLSETVPMFKFISDLTYPISLLKLQGRISYFKGTSAEQKVRSVVSNRLLERIPRLCRFVIVNCALRDRKGTREKDLVLDLKSNEEEAIAIFTVKDHNRPTGIGLVDEFKTIIDEEKSLKGKRVFGFVVARTFSKNAINRCEEYGIGHYTISEILALAG